MKFTGTDLQALLAIPENAYLTKSSEEKYADFAQKDPFPNVSSALLNSSDVIKYILTTGMIDPFVPEKMAEATYNCTFSGKYFYWDGQNMQHTCDATKDKPLKLHPNSITYLEMTPMFRVPHYIALRFNLKVSNAYKGLLLGTGPIVDPGFVGKLYIPLHNLTSNEYVIHRDADLITIEFTKLSPHREWCIEGRRGRDLILLETLNGLNFGLIPYIQKEIKPNRLFATYIEKALHQDSQFCKVDDVSSVSSSVQQLKRDVDDAIKKSEVTNKQVYQFLKDSESRENFIKSFSILAIISLMLTTAGLFISVGWYFNNAQEYSDTYLRKQMQIELEIADIKGQIVASNSDYCYDSEMESKTQLQELIANLDQLKRQLENETNHRTQSDTCIIKVVLFFTLPIIAVLIVFACLPCFSKYKKCCNKFSKFYRITEQVKDLNKKVEELTCQLKEIKKANGDNGGCN
ncbi:MAG: hypothetical protein LBG80_09065 [Bacteroidales bacterium]|jgi:deoxycytidine triphosphate deaminase|nr:hypothetical protein [Bacteroidales bacterium]